ncbi:MAG: beta-ketoacyl-ACP synthase III, partial [Anaerolineae bacterium]
GFITLSLCHNRVDTGVHWVRRGTVVRERHFVSDGESTLTLALEAARNALEVARLSPAYLDLIIVATVTPEYQFPATACLLQDRLGASRAAAFDLSAGCSGFIYGVSLASDAIRAGSFQYALIIGAETLSRIMDWEDRTTCVLFGDGAGAVVLAASQVPGGIVSYTLGADGSGADYLIMPGGGSRHPTTRETVEQRMHYIKMNGREVFKFATRAMDRATRLVCERANVPLDEVELVVPHQANDRIIQAAAKSLGLLDSAFYINLDRYGNTSAASIPIALCEVLEKGLVRRHDHIVLVGFGAGLTWGALLVQWETPFPAVTLKWWQRLYNALYYRWAQLRSWLARLRRRVEGWQTRENGNGSTSRGKSSSSHKEAVPPFSERPGAREGGLKRSEEISSMTGENPSPSRESITQSQDAGHQEG